MAASVDGHLAQALQPLSLEERQALLFLLETSGRQDRCQHLGMFAVEGLGCFACLARVGELPGSR
jgi:hypothetical protein